MITEQDTTRNDLATGAKWAVGSLLTSFLIVWVLWVTSASDGDVWVWTSVAVTVGGLAAGGWLWRDKGSTIGLAVVIGALTSGAVELGIAALVTIVPSG